MECAKGVCRFQFPSIEERPVAGDSLEVRVGVNRNPNLIAFRVVNVQARTRDREYLSLLHRIEFFSSIFKFLAEFRGKFKQL